MQVFFGCGGMMKFLQGGFYTGRIFHREESFQGVNFSGEILQCVNLPKYLYEISLFVLLSLYQFNFTRGDVKGNCPGKFSPGLNCQENSSVGRGIFPWRWSQISWHHLKQDQKLNIYKKTNFFN